MTEVPDREGLSVIEIRDKDEPIISAAMLASEMENSGLLD